MKKKLLWGVAVLAVLVVAGLGLALMYLGPLVKKGVETVGPMVTQVEVKLDSARVGLLSGHGSLKGLVVGNPPGYQSASAMKLGEISVEVVPRSVFADKIHLKSVTILAPEITVEGGLKDNNLTKILANVEAFTGGPATNQTETAAAQKKIQLDSLVLRGAKVRTDLNLPGVPTLNLSLPDIELSNLGQGPEGITAGELTRQLIRQITTRTLTAVAGAAAHAGKALVEGASDRATDAAKSAAGAAEKVAGEAGKALKGVGDLLKPKK